MDIKENKNRNIILDEYAKKYKPEELTDDGIPTIETQLKEISEKDIDDVKNEDLHYEREMILRVKCLCLLKMNKSIFTNTFEMKHKSKEKLQELMWEYNEIDPELIIEEFNQKIGDMFDEDDIDFSKLPIFNNYK